jgi:molybdopterin converting factor small subunit
MGKVILKIPPFFAYVMGPEFTGWFVQDREVGEETTVRDLLTELALINPMFRSAVFDPDEGTVSEGINLILNQKLLNIPLEIGTKLNDKDTIVLLPSLSGG